MIKKITIAVMLLFVMATAKSQLESLPLLLNTATQGSRDALWETKHTPQTPTASTQSTLPQRFIFNRVSNEQFLQRSAKSGDMKKTGYKYQDSAVFGDVVVDTKAFTFVITYVTGKKTTTEKFTLNKFAPPKEPKHYSSMEVKVTAANGEQYAGVMVLGQGFSLNLAPVKLPKAKGAKYERRYWWLTN